MGRLEARALTKVFPGGTCALDAVSFTVEDGRILALLGPSGCGKSTLLRIVAGLERPTSGQLAFDGQAWDALPAGKRDVGFVFQNYALYPHMTVRRNLALALEVRRRLADEIDERVNEVAKLVGIDDLLLRKPAQLSGGQQQRVALGRALVKRPRLYLMDEPLSNLDAQLRESMRTELKSLLKGLGATVLYVTHDQTEAMSLADEVLLLEQGKVRQAGPPLTLYTSPADLFVAGFIGSPRMTLWPARAEAAQLRTAALTFERPASISEGRSLVAGIRPEDVIVSDADPGGATPFDVEVIEPLGDRVLLTLRKDSERLRALTAARSWPRRVFVLVPAERVHWFDAESGRRIDLTA